MPTLCHVLTILETPVRLYIGYFNRRIVKMDFRDDLVPLLCLNLLIQQFIVNSVASCGQEGIACWRMI